MYEDVYQKFIAAIDHAAIPIGEHEKQFFSLLEKIGDARFVLIGEATHGTHQFYQARIEITKQLILKKGFMVVAIEGDWPDVHRIHRFIQGHEGETTQEDAYASLADFKRFPKWMWRNTTMPPFLNWLRHHNDALQSVHEKIGFYGLDLYSLNASMEAVINYLMQVDPNAADRARERYSCFDHMNIDPQTYGFLITAGIKNNCKQKVIEQWLELQHQAFGYLKSNGMAAEDDYFFATQNARVVKDAEIYYRSMFEDRVSSWNIRDKHMAETVYTLANYLENRYQKPAKIIIWAHNSHIGDARATEMKEMGEINIGQLIREHYDGSTYSIGFSTYDGQVTAASHWGAPVQCKSIVPGMEGSYEAVFHDGKYKNFILYPHEQESLEHFLKIPRLQRAIGVIYRPETERASHYFFTHLPTQFDCMIHFDKTTAVRPLDINEDWK
ncbi:erythromycin esterase family protein [Legionella oakridgensis]|uniref:erythromycin esterase family protein n=1 Tax=Legionella oakridgensis TaxID=29423 RepID=UPI0003DE4B39|nr:erythromycin esterase family protein [Legionella oakridgensis]ETO92580.1 erythromycin esterase [Legionella oakridgensis RV-2-2007]